MKILNISAQKPNSTGSGVYLTELIHSFCKNGIENAALCGIDREDTVSWKDPVIFYPVYFNTAELPFPVVGMSDSMPYESTRYRDMTAEMQEQFEKEFVLQLKKAVADFKPDFILCHHLYFLTALVRETFPNMKVGAVSHGTDLRQLQKISMQNERIKKNIRSLDVIFALHEHQRQEIADIFEADTEKIFTIGTGYNSAVFYNKGYSKNKDEVEIIFAGKISEKKGILCLLQAMKQLKTDKKIKLSLAGGYSDEEEYKNITAYAEKVPFQVEFLGKLSQTELAERFNHADIFVLPSFFEGLPLVIVEALACSLKVVATDLPGVQQWLNSHIPDNKISFVQPPVMKKVDEPDHERLGEFVLRLSDGLDKAIQEVSTFKPVDTSSVSWDGVAGRTEMLIQNILK